MDLDFTKTFMALSSIPSAFQGFYFKGAKRYKVTQLELPNEVFDSCAF